MEYVLPDDPAINAVWGPPVKRSALPATLGRPAHKPMPTLPAVRPAEPERPSHRRAQNYCLACGKAFRMNEPRYKLVFLSTGNPRQGQQSSLGIDFCQEHGKAAEQMLKQFFGGDSRTMRPT